MRLTAPRIAPLGKADWDHDVRQIVDRDGSAAEADVFNIMKTLAHHPKLMKRWTVFANHVLMKSTLPVRDREILILRIGWLCQSGYELAQHALIGRQDAGMSEADLKAIAEGPDSAHWDDFEATLLRAADELHADAFVSDETWARLSARYDTQQMMDVVFTVGQYNLVSMVLNSLGVQLDHFVEPYPA